MSERDRRVRRVQQRRRAHRRRRLALALALAAVAGLVVALASGGGSGGRARTSAAASATSSDGAAQPASTAAKTSARPKPAAHHHVASSAGSLPQTQATPSASSTAFKSRMAAFWAGVVSGSVSPAESAFFPQQAYAQLKAIAGASSDWSGRLLRDYALDIAAAHAQLGSHASRAQLVEVVVDANYAHWVPPGACYNAVGYYEMPGARVVYRTDGEVRSFGIASMISWRGEWYVVHLGAVLREGEGGVVDEPASGAGSPAYSGTC
jgi:hypothetical protein